MTKNAEAKPRSKPKTVLGDYQPLPLVFVASLLGVFADRVFDDGFGVIVPFLGWKILFVTIFLGWLFVHLEHRFQPRSRRYADLRPILSTVLLLLAFFTAFGLWHHDCRHRFSIDNIGFYAVQEPSSIALRGVVTQMPRLIPPPPFDPTRVIPQDEKTVFTLNALAIRDGADWISVTGNVGVTIEGDRTDLRIGDSVELFGTLSQPRPPQNPGDSDYRNILRSQRLLCTVRASTPDSITLLKSGFPTPVRLLEKIRRSCAKNIETKMSPETAPFALAMILGIRENIEEETNDALKQTGTMHILTISGLHVGIVAGTLLLAMQFFGFRRRTIAVALIVTITTYLLLTDVRPPAIRATVLVLVVALTMFQARKTLALNSFCATGLVVLALNPAEAFQFGTQLSFIATGAFLWLPRWDGRRQMTDGRNIWRQRFAVLLSNLLQLFTVSLLLWFVSMPMILDRLHLFTPIAVLVNPCLWLPMTAAIFGGFATMIFGGIPFLGDLCGSFTTFSFWFLFAMIDWFAKLGGHYWMPAFPFWWLVVFYTVYVFWTFLPVPKKFVRHFLPFALFWILIGFGWFGWQRIDRYWNDRLSIDILSVGHGSANMITTPNSKTIIFDAGCFSSPKRAADVLSRAIWREGKTSIDALVISHADTDHYNAVPILAERFTIKAVYVSPYMFEKENAATRFLQNIFETKKIPVYVVGDGDEFPPLKMAENEAEFLHPPKENYAERESSNASSLVLRFSFRNVSVLLPGDLDCRTKPPFLDRSPQTTPFIMAPHHGGRSQSSEDLLRWTMPQTILISSGSFTRQEAMLEDWRSRGYILRNTFDEGAIRINIGKNR